MTEHDNLVECAVGVIVALWKTVGGATGLKHAAVMGISAVLVVVAFVFIPLSLADAFLLNVLQANMGPTNAPFASSLSFARSAYFATHVLMTFVGLFSNVFFVFTFIYVKMGVTAEFGGVLPFAAAFIGAAAQIAVYTCLTGYRVVWRLINGHAPGSYELYILLLVAGKAAYLFWLNSQYAAFLEAKKQAVVETAVEAEKIAQEASELKDQEPAEENDEEAVEENDQNEEDGKPESSSESGSTDWEMD